ncbi:hypothetical protein GQ600_15017 [Phytophthora cactorum]|nr:hypothetical protein GQ600_15017 [Phytophthora cactorum]
MHAMEARPASDVLRPQIPRHVSMLSSEIVRPVFQRDMASSSALENTLKRGATRSNVSLQLPTLPVTIQPPSFAADRIQAERCLGSNYNTSTPAYDDAFAMVAEHESEHLRGYETDQLQPKQKHHAKWVERTVQKLRADIPVLELQRTTLRHGRQQDVWNVVVEYFRIFRFGVLVALPRMNKQGEAQTVSNPGSSLDNAETKQQLALLRSSMRKTSIWVNAQNLCLQLCRIERSTTDRFVSVDATLNVTVSEATLENVFPLVKDQFLRSKLLGQHLQVPYSVCFEWDAAACRLSRVETTTNFMTPLMRVLGNLPEWPRCWSTH